MRRCGSMTQGFYKMFQRAAAELRDDPGGDGHPAHTHAVQAAQESHSAGHRHAKGAQTYICNISIYLLVKVWGFNVVNVEHEMEMVFSETDMQMFR